MVIMDDHIPQPLSHGRTLVARPAVAIGG